MVRCLTHSSLPLACLSIETRQAVSRQSSVQTPKRSKIIRHWHIQHRNIMARTSFVVFALALLLPSHGFLKNNPLRKVPPASSSTGTRSLRMSSSTASKVHVLSTITVTADGGRLLRVKHQSASTKTEMVFAIFLPSIYFIGANKAPRPAICKCNVQGEVNDA